MRGSMAYDLKDKVVLITGGANGIGADIVRFLLEEQVKHVAILDINETAGMALQNELNAKHGAGATRFYRVDVTVDDQLFAAFKSVVEEKGALDVVINNAGIMNDAPNVYKKTIAINYTALVTGTLKAIELMRIDQGGKGGTVINIASIAGLYQSSSMPIYFSTKAAVIQFSNCIGKQDYYEKTGVRVVVVNYGATDTGLISPDNLQFMEKDADGQRRNFLLSDIHIQRKESAARGVITAYKHGKSGSTWVATRDQPAEDITANVDKAYEILSERN